MPKPKYKVISPAGVIGFGGRRYAQGDIIEGESSAAIKLWGRCKQIESVSSEESVAPEKPLTKAQQKAAEKAAAAAADTQGE